MTFIMSEKNLYKPETDPGKAPLDRRQAGPRTQRAAGALAVKGVQRAQELGKAAVKGAKKK